MHKASKELAKLADRIDGLIEVLDARTPLASMNPRLQFLRDTKPVILILNKADLADAEITQRWQKLLNQQERCACLVNGRDTPLQARQIAAAATRLTPKAESNRRKRRQLAIAGIPNVGKSSLLNLLCQRKVAKTGNEPAVTQAMQPVKLDDDWTLIDTPGLLWPKLEDQHQAYLLAMTGTIRQTALDIEDAGWYAAEVLLNLYPERLSERYALPAGLTSAEAVFEGIAAGRGALSRGGRPDFNKVAELLLNELRSGKLGRLSFENPDQAFENPEQAIESPHQAPEER